jgi:hypothetical protein
LPLTEVEIRSAGFDEVFEILVNYCHDKKGYV